MVGEGKQSQAAKSSNAGKKPVTDLSVASQTRGKWKSSTVTQEQLGQLSSAGYLPAPEIVSALSALVACDDNSYSMRMPKPRDDERVRFVSHLPRGLGFPIHPFLRGLLHFYGLQFHHLAPNSIMHIAFFVTFCEAFLCSEPSFDLWCKIFTVKPQSNGPEACEYGDATISKIQGAGYLDGTFIETVKNWQEG